MLLRKKPFLWTSDRVTRILVRGGGGGKINAPHWRFFSPIIEKM